MSLTYIKATGEQIEEIVDQIEDVIEGYPTSHVSIACLVVAILAQKPDLDPDKLQHVIKSVSEVIAAQIFEPEEGEVN